MRQYLRFSTLLLSAAVVACSSANSPAGETTQDAAPVLRADAGSSKPGARSSAADASVAQAGTPKADTAAAPGKPKAAMEPQRSAPATAADSGMRIPDAAQQNSARDEDAGSDNCATRITYGSAWIHPTDHADSWDDVNGLVTWDGSCMVDTSGNSFAQLSNGWRPFFQGTRSCVIALDVRGGCAPASQAACSTRVYYGTSWLHPDGHSENFDDVAGVVTSSGECSADGDASFLTLSNGWQPHFMGDSSCDVSFRYEQCGGLFANPVVAADCPDPGVLRDGDRYVMACTSGRPEYPLRVSDDLVHWKSAGSIFTEATKPVWADRDFWAPELHRVGDKYLAYFSARHVDGELAVGVATASNVLGPYTDSGAPLVRDSKGAIDVHEFEAEDGAHYLLWKIDANASGAQTSIMLQPLSASGLQLTGEPTTLLQDSEAWEGGVIEGPWMIFEAGYYYLFYSGNVFSSADYGTGVARSTAITGPFEKLPQPILQSNKVWAGPGHGSVVRTRDGAWSFVFHAWPADRVGQAPPGREVLVTRIGWSDGWPTMLGAPSSLSQPLP